MSINCAFKHYHGINFCAGPVQNFVLLSSILSMDLIYNKDVQKKQLSNLCNFGDIMKMGYICIVSSMLSLFQNIFSLGTFNKIIDHKILFCLI